MIGLLDAVCEKVSDKCLVRRCQRKGCTASLKGLAQQHLIIDFDKPGSPLGPDQTRCDYLIIADDPGNKWWVVPLELKRGQLDVKHVISQLQAGACAAEQIVPGDGSIGFRPAVASGEGVRTVEREALRQRIRFRNCFEPVRRIRCGGSLIAALGA